MIEEITVIDRDGNGTVIATQPDGDQLPRKVTWNNQIFYRLGNTRVYVLEAE